MSRRLKQSIGAIGRLENLPYTILGVLMFLSLTARVLLMLR